MTLKNPILIALVLLVALLAAPFASANPSAGAGAAHASEQQPAAAAVDDQGSSGHLVFVKRTADGTYVPTVFTMMLVVLGAVFLLTRRKRKK